MQFLTQKVTDQTGFTLIELITVLVIIGLLAGCCCS
ncbi:prepilin-type N-terminal cleavage/methylation domain-containing protein [candidate division KSB1 bacterium]|nr:prepilin-type N-terminal cleavage/methylation domain-containing protein [candidate division KSB1 bacterium]